MKRLCDTRRDDASANTRNASSPARLRPDGVGVLSPPCPTSSPTGMRAAEFAFGLAGVWYFLGSSGMQWDARWPLLGAMNGEMMTELSRLLE